MTNTPNPNNEPQNSANRRIWLLWLSRSGFAFGAIVLVGIAAGAWWAWIFVQEQLAPLVEKNLSQSLKRPVKLGKVERFSVNGLRFGASQIPATPTDPDRASVGAIDVGFNIPQMLLNRTLQLDLTLVNPDVYIEQDNNNRWIAGEISVASGSGPIKTEVRSVKVSNAKVVLVPNPKPANPRVPVGIPQLNGKAEFVDKGQRIRFDMGGQLATGGNFNVSGEHLPPSQQTNLQLQGQNLLITDLDRLVKLPLNLSAGRVDGNLTVRYNPAQPLFLLGMARLNDVTAKFQQLPAPFSNTNGVLNFSGQEIKLDNVATRLGQIPLQANGTFHTQNGYDISAQVPNVPIGNITQTLNLKTPVPISAEVRSQVRLTGPNQAPVLLGEFTTTKPAQVDKLQFSSISGRFAFAPATNEFAIANLQAKPTVGGQIIGKGNVKLGQGGGMVFDAEVQNVPGDAIAQQYGVTLSPSIKIGNVSAKAQVFGPLNDIRVAARWQAPQATYPAAGEVIIAKGQTVLRDATFKVAGNTLKAAARIADGRWEALVEGSQLPVKDILAVLPESIPAQEQRRNSQSPVPNPQSLLIFLLLPFYFLLLGAADLNQQLDIRINNGTQGELRNEADRLVRLGGQARQQGNLDKAIPYWSQALIIYHRIGDIQSVGRIYDFLGLAYAELGDYQRAEDALRRRLGVARDNKDWQGQIFGLNNVGTVLLRRGSLSAAQTTFEEALAIARSVNNAAGIGLSLNNLGLVASGYGDRNRAIKLYEEAVIYRSRAGDPIGQANTFNNLGDAYRAVNSFKDTIRAYGAALGIAKEAREGPNQFRAIDGLVLTYCSARQYTRAIELLQQRIASAQDAADPRQELISLRSLAQLYQQIGKYSDARSVYHRAIALARTLKDTKAEATLLSQVLEIMRDR